MQLSVALKRISEYGFLFHALQCINDDLMLTVSSYIQSTKKNRER